MKGMVYIMAIWGEISKGAKDAAAFTVKKTEEITAIAKLKLAIHSEVGKLEKCYQEMGELYYEILRKDVDNSAEVAALLLEADELKTKIAALKAQLASVQRGIICKECGTQVSSEYGFRPICGTKIADDKVEE